MKKSQTRRPTVPLEVHLRHTGLHYWCELLDLINPAGVPQRRLAETPRYLWPETAPLFPGEPDLRSVAHFLPLSAEARARLSAARDVVQIGQIVLCYLQIYCRTSLRSALENVRALCLVVATALRPDGALPPSQLSWETISLVMSLPVSLLDHRTASGFLSARTAAAGRLRGPDRDSAKRTANSTYRKARILLNRRLFPRYLEAGISLPPELELFYREELPKVPPPVYEAPTLRELRGFLRELKLLQAEDPPVYKLLSAALGAGMRKGEALHAPRDAIVTWTKSSQVILQASAHHELKGRQSRAALSRRALLQRLLELTDPECVHLVAERHAARLAAYERAMEVVRRHLGEVAGRKLIHYLRRFYATAHGLADKDLGSAQQSVGHADLDTTFRCYFLRGMTVRHVELWLDFLEGR